MQQFDDALHCAPGALYLAPHFAQRGSGTGHQDRIKQKLAELARAHAALDDRLRAEPEHKHDCAKDNDDGERGQLRPGADPLDCRIE